MSHSVRRTNFAAIHRAVLGQHLLLAHDAGVDQPALGADHKLTPASVPVRGGGGRPAIYAQMLAGFAATKEASVLVEYARKPDTVYNGLANALRKHPEFKGIAVTRRGEKVLLTRKKWPPGKDPAGASAQPGHHRSRRAPRRPCGARTNPRL